VRLARAASLLIGGALDVAAIEAVASAVAEEVEPQGDYLGSVEYRTAMASVLTRRALNECLDGEVSGQ
jgi:CO/xanthine dehydrogenase FAD-binding subunit